MLLEGRASPNILNRGFMKYVVGLICILLSSVLQAQGTDTADAADQKARALHAERVADAIGVGKITVPLKRMVPSKENSGLPWSPYGAKVRLAAEGDALLGELAIGKIATFKVKWTVPKKAGADASFWLDANQDGKFAESERTDIESSMSRGKYWYSGETVVDLPAKAGGTRRYPLSFWRVLVAEVDSEDQSPEVMLWTRDGWSEGQFQMNGKDYVAVISENKKDGVLDTADSWGLGETTTLAYRNSMSKLGKHTWLDGIAYLPTEIDPEGQSLTFTAYDPGLTQEEEYKQNDPYAADKKLARAAEPVAFETNLAKALEMAKVSDKVVVVDFVTTWCGPCKMMDRFVYSAKPVVDAMQSVVAVKLDGDEERAIVKQYQVKGYPTVLLLNSAGEVLTRQVGYVSAARLIALVEAAKKK